MKKGEKEKKRNEKGDRHVLGWAAAVNFETEKMPVPFLTPPFLTHKNSALINGPK